MPDSLFSGLSEFTGFALGRAVAGSLLVLFLPGFGWTLVFFRRLTIAERIALSVGLSIAMVTLAMLFLNVVLHYRITGLNSVLAALVLTAIPAVIYVVRRQLRTAK